MTSVRRSQRSRDRVLREVRGEALHEHAQAHAARPQQESLRRPRRRSSIDRREEARESNTESKEKRMKILTGSQ